MARRKAAARGKISIDEAFHKLVPRLGPHGAVELLNTALRDNRVWLWCNGAVVDPGFIRMQLVVGARFAADGRWSAEIEATRALDKPASSYTWQTDAKRIEALLPTRANPSPRRKPGKQITHDWRLHVAAELHRIKEQEGRTPTAPELAQYSHKTLNYYPDESEVRKLMRFLLSE